MPDLDEASTSFVEWLLEAEASRSDEPFFTRLAPAVVETFQTSCKNNYYFNFTVFSANLALVFEDILCETSIRN